MIEAITQSLPYMGFPRTLDALNCVNEVVPEKIINKGIHYEL